MIVTDLLHDDSFSAASLTEAINLTDSKPRLIRELGIFKEVKVPTTVVTVVLRDGRIAVLPQRERGAPASKHTGKKSERKFFEIPHFPHTDTIKPSDLQNKFNLNPEGDKLDTLQELLAEKLEGHRDNHDQTREFLEAGALSGLVVDSEGNTIVDLFDAFGITQKVIDFDLNSATSKIGEHTRAATRHQKQNLRGDTMASSVALCSTEFFEAFIQHPNVEKAYMYYLNGQQPMRDDVTDGFVFQGVKYIEYSDAVSALDSDGVYQDKLLVEAGSAICVPLGTSKSFSTYLGPADHINLVNKPGEAMYAQVTERDKGKGLDIDSESNVLPVCNRPELLVKLQA